MTEALLVDKTDGILVEYSEAKHIFKNRMWTIHAGTLLNGPRLGDAVKLVFLYSSGSLGVYHSYKGNFKHILKEAKESFRKKTRFQKSFSLEEKKNMKRLREFLESKFGEVTSGDAYLAGHCQAGLEIWFDSKGYSLNKNIPFRKVLNFLDEREAQLVMVYLWERHHKKNFYTGEVL